MKNVKQATLPNLASLAAVVLLAGCATTRPAVQQVEIPIFTSCVKSAPPRPRYEFDQLTPSATGGEIVLALAGDWLRGRAYEQKLEAIVIGCL